MHFTNINVFVVDVVKNNSKMQGDKRLVWKIHVVPLPITLQERYTPLILVTLATCEAWDDLSWSTLGTKARTRLGSGSLVSCKR